MQFEKSGSWSLWVKMFAHNFCKQGKSYYIFWIFNSFGTVKRSVDESTPLRFRLSFWLDRGVMAAGRKIEVDHPGAE